MVFALWLFVMLAVTNECDNAKKLFKDLVHHIV